MSHIRIDRHEAVAVITIDRRERFNSLDVDTARDLRRAGLQCARDHAIRAVVLRGAGGVFCSGADLKYIRDGGAPGDLAYLTPGTRPPDHGYGAVFKQILEYIHSTISEVRRAPKPFIAAVDGIAAAGGFGLAMCCDLVVASDRAVFEWAYGKTSLTGAESSTFFLPRLIGLRRAMELVLVNPRLDATRALEWGLVNAVYPAGTFDADTLALAAAVADGPTPAFAATKMLMNQAAGVDRLDFHLDQELEQLARIADTPDFAEGLAAFFAKRPPRFGAARTDTGKD
ncbi:MAG: enoyl-CoA hydratase-related protein [Vicinamibacterales bacterium]|nr:enoyl-CoA hydratase-related protein [Vicinamibacterales bacterium]